MRRRSVRLLVCAMAVVCAGVSASARIGEKAAELRQRLGKPEAQPQKNILVWLVEESAGALLYTVTFDEKDVSIAEGLKPFRQARMTDQTARAFITEQLSVLPAGHRAREVKAGEAYTFAGEKMTCGPNERVVVDSEHGLLVVWNRASPSSVLVVTSEMVERTRR